MEAIERFFIKQFFFIGKLSFLCRTKKKTQEKSFQYGNRRIMRDDKKYFFHSFFRKRNAKATYTTLTTGKIRRSLEIDLSDINVQILLQNI